MAQRRNAPRRKPTKKQPGPVKPVPDDIVLDESPVFGLCGRTVDVTPRHVATEVALTVDLNDSIFGLEMFMERLPSNHARVSSCYQIRSLSVSVSSHVTLVGRGTPIHLVPGQWIHGGIKLGFGVTNRKQAKIFLKLTCYHVSSFVNHVYGPLPEVPMLFWAFKRQLILNANPDTDWTIRFNPNSRWTKFISKTLSFVRVPAPKETGTAVSAVQMATEHKEDAESNPPAEQEQMTTGFESLTRDSNYIVLRYRRGSGAGAPIIPRTVADRRKIYADFLETVTVHEY